MTQRLSLLESAEFIIADSLLTEMANLQPKSTGLSHTVNVLSGTTGQHAPRVKVSNIPGKFSKQDNFSVTLEAEPRVVGTCKIKSDQLNDIVDWVKLNREHLHKVWHDDGELDIDDIASGFKSL